jgi:hypothetical protein
MVGDSATILTTLDEQMLPSLPAPIHVMTVRVEIPPGGSGTPPHRHSGPVFGYLLEGEMIYELEGDLPDRWTRFIAVMHCVPGQPMLTLVPAEELEARRPRRHPGPVYDPRNAGAATPGLHARAPLGQR